MVTRGSLLVAIAAAIGLITNAPANALPGAPVLLIKHGAAVLARGPQISAEFLPDRVVFQRSGTATVLRFPGSKAVQPRGGRLTGIGARRIRQTEPAEPLVTFESVHYKGLYAGVDAVFRAGPHGLKSEFVVAAGADPEVIRLSCEGEMTVRDHYLEVRTPVGVLRDGPLVAYQEKRGAKVAVEVSYWIVGDRVIGFRVGPYDRTLPLVIDPEIEYSTYVGGSRFDGATAVAADDTGNAYIAGWTESLDLRTSSAAQSSKGGGVDAFVAKLDRVGRIVYCTYLGGSGDDRAFGIAVDSTGSAVVTGWSTSANFPTTSPVQAALRGSRDAFIAKLTPAGDGLIYSTYFGGAASDSGNAVAVDRAGNAYIAGETNSSDLPMARPIQGFHAGLTDAFLSKFDSTGRLVFSTFLGGSNDDRATAIAVSGTLAYVAGGTGSRDFPVAAAFQGRLKGGQDAFISKVDTTNGVLQYSTYLGGSAGTPTAPETAYGVAVDAAGSAVVTGITPSADFPVVNAFQPALHGWNSDAFVAKLNASGSALLYSTFLGGTNADAGTAVALDSAGRAHVTGWTTSSDFPTAAASQSAKAGGIDMFVATLSSAGDALVYATYLGGADTDAARGIAVEEQAVVVAGQTLSYDFPVANSAQPGNPGNFGAALTRLKITQPAQRSRFFPVAPCRIMDTRADQGKVGAFGPPALPGGTERVIPVPASGCGVPASAVAYSLNITVVPRGVLRRLAVWPTGQPEPETSNLSSYSGLVVADAAIVQAGVAGAITIKVQDTTDVIVDVNGYFANVSSPGDGYQFYPITPCRVVDTRVGYGKTGPFGPPAFAGYVRRDIPVLESGCGVPSTAVAYSTNITVLPAGFLGFLITWPAGLAQPTVSTLNSYSGDVMANAAVIPAGTGGAISMVVRDTTHVIVDLNGYFAKPGSPGGLDFFATAPCRILDTGIGQGKTGAFGPPALQPYEERDIPIPSSGCGIPATALAYAGTFSVRPNGFLGYLIVWPSGITMPTVSTLNSYSGLPVSNSAIVPAGTGGAIRVKVRDATDLAMDISGYFAP